MKAQDTPRTERINPKTRASLGLVIPVLSGLLLVLGIMASISRSYHIFKTVLPLMESNKLPANPIMTGILKIGQRALIYPASPVISSSPVCKDLTSGKYFFLKLLNIDFMISIF